MVGRMSQLPLFRSERAESAQRPPDLAHIRKSLNRLLRLAREAQIMPWSEAETESWEKLFPELAASLPTEEAETMTSEFRSELARISSGGCALAPFPQARPHRRLASLRGRTARVSLRAPRLPHHRAATLSHADRAVAHAHECRRYLLRARRRDAPLPAKSEGGDRAQARPKLRGRARPPASRHQCGAKLDDVPGAARGRRIRFRAAGVSDPLPNPPPCRGRSAPRSRQAQCA